MKLEIQKFQGLIEKVIDKDTGKEVEFEEVDL